ncbi:ribosome biogenesis GTPase Der [Candidatus Symbiobacter mobilis]|uniref:GTPase Der n=1 Tax=Candidatus Symbiobacter mobilis CR TaxID=946483 RepID=U5NCH7_9BURK|nr:ribosome biogenesis GTPase Der [Candidatus Symbiobacter mobilis]AGX87923.1 GTP-binding protein [Candidatus Symbiobacter mobilis CR]
MQPVLALVGRTNVGKSTLFNRLTRTRDAIVADMPGLTRDRRYGTGKHAGRSFLVVDTGGFEPSADTGIVREMAKQTRQAIADADVVLLVTDTRAGLNMQDHAIATELRRANKPCILVANKAEGMFDSPRLAEFYELGFPQVFPLSAEHGHGIEELLDHALSPFHAEEKDNAPAQDNTPNVVRLAVAGRPNVGKSTLLNVWLGEERLVTFDAPGTTRDAIVVPFERNGQRFELIDTAGLRRRGKVFEAVEKFSVIKTLQAIESSNVVLLMIDATDGVTDLDAHIAGYLLEKGRAVVVAINKWDAVDDYHRQLVQTSLATRLGFLRYAEVHTISARNKQGLGPLWKALLTAYRCAFHKMPTSVLTRVLLEAVRFQAPRRAQMFRPKLRFAHQGGSNPPMIVIHGNSLDHISDAYRRYLEGRFRKAFDLVGTPLRIEFRTTVNPYR